VLQAKERAPTPSPFVAFIFRFTVESIKELGGASLIIFKYCIKKNLTKKIPHLPSNDPSNDGRCGYN
jgi:hypothetical protein